MLMTPVAVIHESDAVRRTLSQWLDSSPHYGCVYAAATGKDALAEIPRRRPAVVLMDAHLPGESAVTCLTRLKRKLPKLQVVIVAASTEADVILQVFQAGAAGYLLQSSTREQILSAVAEVLAGGVPMTPEIARRVIGFLQPPLATTITPVPMSRRETEVLDLLASGLSNKHIAERMGISYETVCVHLRRVYKKLRVHSRSSAIVKHLRARFEAAGAPLVAPIRGCGASNKIHLAPITPLALEA
jgi:DNA-binding NarL/FixJ family response regulator